MVGVVEGFRWALLGTNTAPGPIVIVPLLQQYCCWSVVRYISDAWKKRLRM